MTVFFRAIVTFVAAALLLASPAEVFAQSAILQGGAITAGHVPMYINSYSQQPIAADSGPAAGGPPGTGLSELGVTVRAPGLPPYANAGTGNLGTNVCDYDGPVTSAAGYHSLCFSPNAQGGGLIAYNAFGSATPEPLTIEVNGTTFTLPGSTNCLGCGTIATQNANNVAITGGSISGVSFTFNGIFYHRRTVAGSLTADTASLTDAVINWNSAANAAKVETLPACSIGNDGETFIIKDEAQTAGLYPITLTPASGTIEKSATFPANTGAGSWTVVCDGSTSNWTVN